MQLCSNAVMQLCSLHIFAVIVRLSIYFPWDAKYVSTFFLSWHWLAKIYVKWNLRKSSIMYVRELLYIAYVCPYILYMYEYVRPHTYSTHNAPIHYIHKTPYI